jgi:hypothetical protein
VFQLSHFHRNEPEQVDKIKGKKSWLFPKKKASTICTANVKSPETPILCTELIDQMIFLMDFLEKDESELNS